MVNETQKLFPIILNEFHLGFCILDQNNFDESASTSQLTDDQNVSIEADAQDDNKDTEADGVSSGQDGVQVKIIFNSSS